MTELTMQIPANHAISYPISIAHGLLTQLPSSLLSHCQNKKIVIITDDQVNALYGKNLAAQLADYQPLLLTFPAGEAAKTYQTKQLLEEQMLAQQCGRDTIIIALGGGVVGDLAGFIAATYMRGIPFIQIPTTLLAMVDSSVGGKTGINTAYGKNLIGAFWQPAAVMVDPACLQTLMQDQFTCGLIEAIKMALTHHVDDFHFIRTNLAAIFAKDQHAIHQVIQRAISTKISVVSADEKENNLRMILNFGHTIGHALEKLTQYQLLHGHAVGYGILVEAKIAELQGLLSQTDYLSIESLLALCDIHRTYLAQFNDDGLIAATKNDKKAKHGDVRYILLKQIGEIYHHNHQVAHPIADNIVKQALINIREVTHGRQ